MPHTHRPSRSRAARQAESDSTRCYTGPVRFDGRVNPAAHGGVCFVQHCACGARRTVNASAGHREYGDWTPTDTHTVY